MRATIFSQRDERDRLLARPYLTRHIDYDIDQLLAAKQIKLLTGPRRAGKSTQALLMLRGKNFAYLNFDDNNLLKRWDEAVVMSLLNEVYPSYDYLLLDEVQNLDGWDVWVSKLYRNGTNLVVTGSNAKMLSSEMATALTGRYLEIKIFPFSLAEFFEWSNIDPNALADDKDTRATALASDYLRQGGYPETIESRSITSSYLSTLFDAIVWKDVVERHKIRNVADLNNVALYLLSNFCNPLTATNLAEGLGLSSVNTAKKYMGYLAEPFLFFYLPRYNNKLRLMTKAARKVYVVDNGFVTARAFNLSENYGRMLENLVFVELLRRGYDTEHNKMCYYKSRNNKKTDFVLRNGNRVTQLIQVCLDMSSKKTEKREVSALLECAEELHCDNLVIVTESEQRTIESSGHTIKVIPFTKF